MKIFRAGRMPNDAVRFVDLYLCGDILADRIDDFVDLWHASDSKANLAEFLGFSDEEFALWVEDPKSLTINLDARQAAMLSSLEGRGDDVPALGPGSYGRRGIAS